MDRLVFRVRYGIGKFSLFFIKENDLRKVDDNEYELTRQIELVSKIIWASPVRVDVQLCYLFRQDCFLGESHSNPVKSLLLLDSISLECTSRQPNGSVPIE
jgi:hypothetical protein